MGIVTLPLATMANKSSAMAWVDSRLAMWVNSVGRDTYSEPLEASKPMSSGSTLPDALPKLATRPNGLRQSSDFKNVSLPTESYTTLTPLPPVMSFTRATKSSFA